MNNPPENNIPDSQMPLMPEVSCNALMSALRDTGTYLEFGMGGSTMLAARLNVPNIISVDSSEEWVNKIAIQVSQLEQKGNVRLLHANIGKTGIWGFPVDTSKITNWPYYFTGPWKEVKANGLDPDLVLIDGRFRVCCFLYSLINLKPGSTILWDDYKSRNEYHFVEKFLSPVNFHDRMAEFRVTENRDIPAIVSCIFENLYKPG